MWAAVTCGMGRGDPAAAVAATGGVGTPVSDICGMGKEEPSRSVAIAGGAGTPECLESVVHVSATPAGVISTTATVTAVGVTRSTLSVGKGRVFSLFGLFFWFHQITAHKDAVLLAAICTLMGIYEWLVTPQGSSASPRWFVKVINEVIKGLFGTGGGLPRRCNPLPLRSNGSCEDNAGAL